MQLKSDFFESWGREKLHDIGDGDPTLWPRPQGVADDSKHYSYTVCLKINSLI